MKYVAFIILFVSSFLYSQEAIEIVLINETPLQADNLVAVDHFNSLYYIDHDVFYKKDDSKLLSYSNLQLGTITASNAYNPLKINLFYKDFNMAIILDNRLAEIFKIDFNTLQPYRNISHISTGNDNTLWVFNQDTQQLEVFDYKTNTSRAKTLPVQSTVLDIKSNYNYCWLLTQDHLLVFNYFGTLIKKLKNDGYIGMAESNGNLILKKEHALFYLKTNETQPAPIKTPNLLINQFFVTNETLYIYNNEILRKYKIKTN